MDRATMTAAELMEELHITRPTMNKLMRSGGLPFIRVGRKLLFPTDRVREWMAEREEAERA